MNDATREVIGGPYDFDDWNEAARESAIDFGIFVQTVAQPEETPEILALAPSQDRLAGVVGWIDVDGSRPPGDLLDDLRQGPGGDHLIGIRVAGEYVADPDWIAGDPVRATASALAERDLSLDLLTDVRILPAATRLAAASPEARIVLDHLSKPTMARADFDFWAAAIRDLARHPNVACKLSGYLAFDDEPMTAQRLRPYAETVLESFGPDRVMFGSDWPVCILGGGYRRAVELAENLLAPLSEDEREQVWSGTARRWYPSIGTVVDRSR
ncbi:amidohydrolase family protein [Pseudactinotalea sp. Z1748]|uniref:amidohydrolase family protein n=1 Tax=Pseudactinotalea sp. Z1748 TaxID=3413027 RepID=UPI003C7D11E5